MTSWRATTTQPVQDDLDALVTLAVDHAQHLLKKNGEFFPFGVAMSDEGVDYFFSADPGLGKHPESQLVLDLLYDVAAAAKEGNRAVGFVADVTFSGADEVRIETDHRDDATGLVFMVPYQRKGLLKKSVAYGQMRTHTDARLVWTD